MDRFGDRVVVEDLASENDVSIAVVRYAEAAEVEMLRRAMDADEELLAFL